MSEQWKTDQFRENIVNKLRDHIVALNINVKTDASTMENNIFKKASSEHEYLAYIAKLIVYMKEKQPQSSADPTDSTSQRKSASVISSKSVAVKEQTKLFTKETSVGMSRLPECIEPSSAQKLAILKTAIATVIQNPNWHMEDGNLNQNLKLFGLYVATQLNQISDEEQLVSTQQKILALINKSV